MQQKGSISTEKIGVLGSSAGGHLASTLGTHYEDIVIENPHNMSLRPDFMILNYPVISFADSLTHYGSRFNLIGTLPNDKLHEANSDQLPVDRDLISYYSNELHVNDRTPPTFITHAYDDDGVKVQNSILFIAALQQHGVPVTSFFYANGGHGYGMDNPTSDIEWIDSCIKWIKSL